MKIILHIVLFLLLLTQICFGQDGYIDRDSGVVYWQPATSAVLNVAGTYIWWVHTTSIATGREADTTISRFSVFEVGT